MLKKNPILDYKKIKQFDTQESKDIVEWHEKQIVPIASVTTQENEDFLFQLIIIRTVAMIENYMKNLVKELIDIEKLDTSKLFKNNEVIISLNKLDNFKQNITVGKIVATSFNFQNPKEIKFVLSNLFELDFMETFKILMSSTGNEFKNLEEGRKPLRDNLELFFDMFKIRNEIAHSINLSQKLDKFKENDVISVAVYFIMFTSALSKMFVKYLKTGKTFPELDKVLKEQSEIWRKEYSVNPPL